MVQPNSSGKKNLENFEFGWQPTLEQVELTLAEITFVVIDLETTGGSPTESKITEIGAVKVRGGEVIQEFQTLVNPDSPIPPFITVLTGITNAMVIEAPKIGEAFFSLLEFIGSEKEVVLIAHNSPFDIGFLKAAAESLNVAWPKYQVLDTARISRYALSKDEVSNFKLASLATFFGATTDPNHRALSDARATVDVFHGILERLGSMGVFTLSDLKSFSNRITEAQRRKRHFADQLPQTPGVYIFRDEQDEPLYIGTTRNLKQRVRSYFTAAETRRRIHDMIALASRVDFIETATILEAEIRELRLISEFQPRFNRRSRFQSKAIAVKITQDDFPRLSVIRGIQTLDRDESWLGPFSSRDEATLAVEAIYEVFPIRQCTSRISLRSMRNASPCALLDIGKCGAPCVGLQSTDSYSTITAEVSSVIDGDSRVVLERLLNRMQELSLRERFEDAAVIRNRIGAFAKGAARSQRIKSLTAISELVVARNAGDLWEIYLIRYGRLVASMSTSNNPYDFIEKIKLVGEVVSPSNKSLPASSHEEVELLLRFIHSQDIRIMDLSHPWVSPTFGGDHIRAGLDESRFKNEAIGYKEDFANPFETSRQR
jgi:DNA polymerase-3 subunit epsilon